MPLPSLCVSREFSSERLNAIVNHPEVRPWVGGAGPLDLSGVVANLSNYLLMGTGGGFLFIRQEPGIYEVHSQFLPDCRGKAVVQAGQDAARYMFTRTDCVEIRSKVPDNNRAALGFARVMGWELQFHREHAFQSDQGICGIGYYSKSVTQWANTAPGIAESGEWFHEKLEVAKIATGSQMPVHDHDDAHDRYVGATVEMMQAGQVGKALAFYNRWAPFAGYAMVSVVSTDPVVIDIRDALLALRGEDFDVILCR